MTTPAPYPAETRAKGWRFELDYEQIEQSDTWDLAGPEGRPWLLMMWLTAWRQVPCGSFPNDEAVIAAKLGMPAKAWTKYRAVLLRGWSAADDGRLYHATMTARVTEMMKRRRSDSDRQAERRKREAKESARQATESQASQTGVTGMSRVTPTGVRPESSTEYRPPTRESNLTVATPRPPSEGPQLALIEGGSKPAGDAAAGPPDCPHLQVLALWAEKLPALPQHKPAQWKGARADHLRARWREQAVQRQWSSQADGLEWFGRLFAYVGQSKFLTGQVPPRDTTKPPFVAELEWVVMPGNFAKLVEGKYHRSAAA